MVTSIAFTSFCKDLANHALHSIAPSHLGSRQPPKRTHGKNGKATLIRLMPQFAWFEYRPTEKVTPQFSWWSYGRASRYLINKFGIIEERVVSVWEMYRRKLPEDSKRVNSRGEEEFLLQVA